MGTTADAFLNESQPVFGIDPETEDLSVWSEASEEQVDLSRSSLFCGSQGLNVCSSQQKQTHAFHL